jgi:hypothetical protein
MIFDSLTQQSATILAAVFTGLVSVQTFILNRVNHKFDKLGTAITETTLKTQDWLREHEEKDSERHIENLSRFEKISVALARLGHFNGNT